MSFLDLDGLTYFYDKLKTWANSAFLGINDTAVSATSATQDASGNVITSTYATKTALSSYLPLSGGTIKGSIYAVSFKSTSDKRLKSDITEKTIDLSSVTPYSYYFTNDKKRTPHVGLIAQEVEEVLPEAVSVGEDGYKALDYNAVVAALVGEVNALKKRVAELEARLGDVDGEG